MTSAPGRRAVVVGGGIAGLTAALELAEAGAAVTLLEANASLGGKIATFRHDGLVVEAGADSVLSAKPAALELCRRLGLEHRVVDTRREDRTTSVWWAGRLRPLPEGLVLGSPARAGALLRTGLLSPEGAARMAGDLLVKPRQDGADESIASFFTRRLGKQAYLRVVEPLLAGIHAGDATQLSLAATFPRFVAMEQDHGGLVRATLAGRRSGGGVVGPSAPGHTPFVSLRGGMGELTDALARALTEVGGTVHTGTRVTGVHPATDAGRDGPGVPPESASAQGRYVVELGREPGPARHRFEAAAVVLATPAHVTADLLRPLCPEAARLLAQIPHAGTATVSLAYDNVDIGRRPRGFGFVVPRAANRRIIAATWSSQKWPDRAPGGQTLVRGYVGGTGREEILGLSDDAIIRVVESELYDLAGIDGVPLSAEVHRFPLGMPQYTIGHLDRVAGIRAALRALPGLAVTGAAYGGVGIPDCITDALTTARALDASGADAGTT